MILPSPSELERRVRKSVAEVGFAAGEAVDRAFVRMAFSGRRVPRQPAKDVVGRVDLAGNFYGLAAREGRLFPDPQPVSLRLERLRALPGGELMDVLWPSGYAALHDEHHATLSAATGNAVARARWLRHEQPAPVVIALHGWGGGHFAAEAISWRADRLFSQGLDVVLATLPFHALRAARPRGVPLFPSTDPVRTNEGFAQAVLDLRALMAALRDLGAPAVGIAGMSLGGATAALMCTVEPRLDFAIPMLPVASVAELMWKHGKGTAAHERARKAGLSLARFESAFAPTSPLTRKAVVAGERILFIAGERDRVVPIGHAERLHAHFPGSRLITFPGSHLVQLGRGAAFDEILAFLRRLEVLG